MKIGVVVPIYNVASFLPQCIESLKNQTYKDIIVLLVDDGSTDKSLEIVLQTTAQDERFVLICKENGGLSSARNVGIEFFGGKYTLAKRNDEVESLEIPPIDYLSFVDSDDFLELDTFEKCLDKMQDVEVLWFNTNLFYDKCDEIEHTTAMEYYHYKEEQIITSKEWLKKSKKNGLGFFWYSYHGLINFAFLKSIKLKFIDNIIHEDNIFGILLFANAKKIYVYPKNFYHYRIRPNSIMNFSSVNLESSPPSKYLAKIYDAFERLDEAKAYHKAYSWYESALRLNEFLKHNKNKYQNKLLKECFLKSFCLWTLWLWESPADPLKVKSKENLRFLKQNARGFISAYFLGRKRLKNNKKIIKIETPDEILKQAGIQ